MSLVSPTTEAAGGPDGDVCIDVAASPVTATATATAAAGGQTISNPTAADVDVDDDVGDGNLNDGDKDKDKVLEGHEPERVTSHETISDGRGTGSDDDAQ